MCGEWTPFAIVYWVTVWTFTISNEILETFLLNCWLYFIDYLKPYLNHSFKNVRERLGSILINIFEADLKFVDAPEPECPRINDIISDVLQKIQILKMDDPKGIRNGGTFESISILIWDWFDDVLFSDDAQMEDTSDDAKKIEYDQAVRLFKTSKKIIVIFLRSNEIQFK